MTLVLIIRLLILHMLPILPQVNSTRTILLNSMTLRLILNSRIYSIRMKDPPLESDDDFEDAMAHVISSDKAILKATVTTA
jgi:hypothetical protein